MDTNHFRYFLSIIEHGSMSATAKKLGLSQPALSSAVQSLEKHFGTTLMIRDRSGVILTSTGEELQRCAQDIMARLDEATTRMKRLESGSEGNFKVGCHESLGAYFLPEFLASFLREEPQIEVSLWNGTSAATQQAVLSRNVDFGLVVNPHPYPDVVIVDLCEDAVDLFVAATPEQLAKDRVEPKEPTASSQMNSGLSWNDAVQRLRTGPLIYAGRVYQAQDLIGQLEAQNLLPERRISCGDLEMVKSMAIADVGVAVLPRRVAAYGALKRLRRLHPLLPHFPDRICMVYRSDLHRTRAAMALKNALLQHGRRLREQGDGFVGGDQQTIATEVDGKR